MSKIFKYGIDFFFIKEYFFRYPNSFVCLSRNRSGPYTVDIFKQKVNPSHNKKDLKLFEENLKIDEHCGISLNNTMAMRALCTDHHHPLRACGYVNCTMQFRCVGISKIDFLL